MKTLLIKNIASLVSCDEQDTGYMKTSTSTRKTA